MSLLYSEVKEALLTSWASKNDGQMFKQMFSTCVRVTCFSKSRVFESNPLRPCCLILKVGGPKVFQDDGCYARKMGPPARGILTWEKFLEFLTERQEIKDTRNLVFYPDLKNDPIHKTLSNILLNKPGPAQVGAISKAQK